jgi:hypothetical protein
MYSLILTTNGVSSTFGKYDTYMECTNAALDLINYHNLSRDTALFVESTYSTLTEVTRS